MLSFFTYQTKLLVIIKLNKFITVKVEFEEYIILGLIFKKQNAILYLKLI